MQRPLAGGIAEGFMVDGSRSWTGHLGPRWDLAIDRIEMRCADPVPQAGSYALESTAGKTLSLGFSRVDADTIRRARRVGEVEPARRADARAAEGARRHGTRGAHRCAVSRARHGKRCWFAGFARSARRCGDRSADEHFVRG